MLTVFSPGDLTARAAGAAEMTVYAQAQTTRTVLDLQPGFATIIRADRPIDTVAIGDPRMVTATPVRRGNDVFDVVLQPQTDSGATNMVIWLGALTTVWDLKIGSAPRSADVVLIVTHTVARQPVAAPARPVLVPGQGGTTPPAPAAPVGRNDAAPPGTSIPVGPPPPPRSPAGPPVATPPPSVIELRQDAGAVTAVFRAYRTRGGVFLRYAITNGGPQDLMIKPATILLRVNGRPVAYGMARDSVDRGRPDIIPRGATETGIIDVTTPDVRRVELILALIPVGAISAGAANPASGNSEAPSAAAHAHPPADPAADRPQARAGTTPAAPAPIVLQATFTGIGRLPVTQTP